MKDARLNIIVIFFKFIVMVVSWHYTLDAEIPHLSRDQILPLKNWKVKYVHI